MSAQELMSLAERVERATGADARLGAEIEIAARGFPERAYNQKNAMRPRGAPELDRLEWAASYFGAGPTASLDAAMTLVPEEHSFNCGNDVQPWAHVWFDVPAYDGQPYSGRAATPALALCAASLRARASSDAGGRG